MKNLTVMAAAIVLALPVFGQGIKDAFARHWQTSAEFTIAVAEAMPGEDYNFKPNSEEMSFGKVMVHIAMANNGNFALATGNKAPAVPEKIAAAYKDPNGQFDKAETVQFLKDSFAFCTKVLDQTSDDQLHEMTGPAGHQMVGMERLWSYFTHTAHHRGQAEVYLRVKGIKPPLYKF